MIAPLPSPSTNDTSDASTNASRPAARVRGSLIDRWDEHVRRRWGNSALIAATRAIALRGLSAPTPVDPTAWYPVELQLAIAQHTVEAHLNGDWMQLPAIVAGDVRHVLGRAKSAVVRALGPGTVVANADKLYRESYDVGRLDVLKHGRRHFEFAYHDAPLFDDATWRRVQVAAWTAVFDLTGKTAEVTPLDGDGFRLGCRW